MDTFLKFCVIILLIIFVDVLRRHNKNKRDKIRLGRGPLLPARGDASFVSASSTAADEQYNYGGRGKKLPI